MAVRRVREFRRVPGGSVELGLPAVQLPPTSTNDALPVPAQPTGSPVTWPTRILAENFDGTSLNGGLWTNHEPWQGAPGYMPEDSAKSFVSVPPHPSTLQVANSVLTLPVTKQRLPGQPAHIDWTGQVLTTRDKFSLPGNTRCYVEFRVKLPPGKGLWPILWLLGNGVGVDGWSKCGEVDLFEMANGGIKPWDGTTDYGHGYFVAHWAPDGTTGTHTWTYRPSALGRRLDLFDGGWHTIGLDRYATRMERRIDGVLDLVWEPGVSYDGQLALPQMPLFTDAMHLKISSQMGSDWATTGLTPDQWQPGALLCDYVGAWRM